jgi:hypothetical protein
VPEAVFAGSFQSIFPESRSKPTRRHYCLPDRDFSSQIQPCCLRVFRLLRQTTDPVAVDTLANPRPPDQHILTDSQITPFLRFGWIFLRQFDGVRGAAVHWPDRGRGRQPLPRCRRVRQWPHGVGASPVGTGNVHLIVGGIQRRFFVSGVIVDVRGSEVFEFFAAGLEPVCASRASRCLDALNEQSAVNHLLSWSMAMSGRRASRLLLPPKNQRTPSGNLTRASVGFAGVGNVTMQMSPVGGIRQCTRAESDELQTH